MDEGSIFLPSRSLEHPHGLHVLIQEDEFNPECWPLHYGVRKPSIGVLYIAGDYICCSPLHNWGTPVMHLIEDLRSLLVGEF